MKKKVYLDYNATTPLHPELLPLVTETVGKFGNASSVHWAGREAKKLISQARDSLSQFLHCDPLEIIFTSGGSESNNLALKGLASAKSPRKEIICSTVEHPSVLKTVEFLKDQGFFIHWLNVSKSGDIDLNQLEKVLSEKTLLVTCQLVNNETGNIFPLKKIARLAHKVGAYVHSDMVQALGKIPVDLSSLDVDFASFAGHKFYGLKGAGVLFAKKGVHLEPLIHGGGQERNRRAGTENALAIATLGEAVRRLGPLLSEKSQAMEQMRNGLESRVLKEIPGTSINGVLGKRVSNTSNIFFDRIDGETLLINLDTRGFAISSGAACSSGSQEPSPVLVAMGMSPEDASQSLRISLGWLTETSEVDEFFENLKSAVAHIRDIHGAEALDQEFA